MIKKTVILLSLIALTVQLAAQGIHFTEGTWQEILQQAKDKNCPVFVDIYTSWCGPCKKMVKEVFTQEEAGTYFNTHFINYKIDAEKGEGIQIARQFNVKAYPTCLFVNGDGKLVSSFMGALTVKELVREGKKAVENFSLLPQIREMDTAYRNGRQDTVFLKEYCLKRSQFGEKGGMPVNVLLNQLSDEALTDKRNGKWIQEMTVYDEALLQRLIRLVEVQYQAGPKVGNVLNGNVMKALSTFINQNIDGNEKAKFDKLLDFKQQMVRINKQNEDNSLMASMGGGMAYIAPEQLKLTFYTKNRYDKEFMALFLEYIRCKMKETPADSLIATSNRTEKEYADFMKSDTISESSKKEMQKGREFIQLFANVQNMLLSSTFFNGAAHYWKLQQAPTATQEQQYLEWLQFCYALNRKGTVAVAVAEKLVELGRKEMARSILDDMIGFLQLKGDPDNELKTVQEALNKLQ